MRVIFITIRCARFYGKPYAENTLWRQPLIPCSTTGCRIDSPYDVIKIRHTDDGIQLVPVKLKRNSVSNPEPGRIKIRMFSDYSCPWCMLAYAVIESMKNRVIGEYAKVKGVHDAYVRAMWEAYLVNGIDIGNTAEICRIAELTGLNADEIALAENMEEARLHSLFSFLYRILA